VARKNEIPRRRRRDEYKSGRLASANPKGGIQQALFRQHMIDGSIVTREENLKIAEEFWPIVGETLPDDDWSEYGEQD
jgi:hypothetical protein